MKRREKILTGATASLLLFFVLNHFMCGKSADSDLSSKATTMVASTATNIAKSLRLSQKTPSDAPRPIASSDFSLGRDPFAESYRLSQRYSAQAKDFTLRGIIWQGDEAHVLIGSDILAEGEESGDLKVLDIQENKVVCRKANKIITLMLEKNEK